MTVAVKICGLKDADAVRAAAVSGAAYAGFVFYPGSPRCVTPFQARDLVAQCAPHLTPVGLFVDAGDDEIRAVLTVVSLRMLQLHGNETVERVREVKNLTGLSVCKAIGVAADGDIDIARSYADAADFLMLDAKPASDGLPGGNAVTFNWSLLEGIALRKPWFLAGGLTPANVGAAIRQTGACFVDVSSGVEDTPGQKNTAKIAAFVAAAQQSETSS